jgi:hypothetical protein
MSKEIKSVELTEEQLSAAAELAKKELTAEENEYYQERATELAKKYNVSKVHVYVGIDETTGERVVGYLKEPNYTQKIMAMDKIATVGIFVASDELRAALTLKGEGESDERTYSDFGMYDSYKLGMAGTATTILEVVKNSFKKK